MSNFLSEKAEFNKVRSSYDLALISNVIDVKNQRFEANSKEAQDAVNEFARIDVISEDGSRENYVKNKIQGLVDYINTSGNVNFERGNVQRQIQEQTSKILDEKILNDIANTAKFRNFQKEVAKAKEGKNGEYNQINEIDAKEISGFDNWYKDGNSKGYGNISYFNYVDVIGKMSKKAQEYSKLMGKERLLNSTTGQYYTTDQYGKVVTMSEIYNTLKTELSQDDLTQLQINTRQSLGKLPQEELSKLIDPQINSEINQIRAEQAVLKAEMLAKPKAEQINYVSKISEKDDLIKEKKSILENKKYNLYDIYIDDTIKKISSNYDFEEITDVKRDYGNLNILKYQHDILKDERDYQLKLRNTELREKGNTINSTPTEIDKPRLPEEQENAFNKVTTEQVDSLKALDTILTESNENGYKQMTPQEKFAYRINLEISPKDTIERQNLIRSVQTSSKVFREVVNKNTETLKDATKDVYDSFTGVKLENLKNTAPYTVAAKKTGKSFEELDKNVQKAVMLELGSNVIEFEGASPEKEKIIKSSLHSLAAQLKNHPSEKVKDIFKQVEFSYNNIIGNGNLKNVNRENVISGGSYGIAGGGISPTSYNTGIAYRGFSFNQDNNITEIEDNGEDAKIDALRRFNIAFDDMYKNTDKIAKVAEKNLITNKAFAFSTEDKYQKIDAEKLKQTVLLLKGEDDTIPAPSNNNSYAVSKKGTGYEISYLTGKSDDAKITRVYVDKLTPEIAQKFQQGESNWNNSFKNPNLITPTLTYKPDNFSNTLSEIKEIQSNRPDVISPQTYINIVKNKSFYNTPFQTKEEYLEQMKGQPIEKVKQAEYFLDATYQIKPKVENGILMGDVNIIYSDGRKEVLPFYSESKELDNTRLYMEGMQYIKSIKDSKIEKIFN